MKEKLAILCSDQIVYGLVGIISYRVLAKSRLVPVGFFDSTARSEQYR